MPETEIETIEEVESLSRTGYTPLWKVLFHNDDRTEDRLRVLRAVAQRQGRLPEVEKLQSGSVACANSPPTLREPRPDRSLLPPPFAGCRGVAGWRTADGGTRARTYT